jgi:hypothetical protein
MQSALLHFESNAFGIDPRETAETNPDIFGRSLAEWVGERLREQGLPAEAVIAEDFGWCVPVRLAPHAVYVACASEEEMPDSWRWQLFVFAEGGSLRRLFGTDTRPEAVQRVFSAVRRALESSPDIRNLSEEPV